MGDMERKNTLMVFALSSVLILSGFSTILNQNAYAQVLLSNDPGTAPVTSQAIVPPQTCVGGETDLLIQDNVPWIGFAVIDSRGAFVHELILQGKNWCSIDSSAIGVTNLSQFSVIILASDQATSFYTNIMPGGVIHPAIDSWVLNGGILSASLADSGFASGSWAGSSFVGGLTQIAGFDQDLTITSPAHPLIANGLACPSGNCGVVVDTGVQTDIDSFGFSAHNAFTALPAGTTVILTSPSGPVAIEYPHGAGIVVANTVTDAFMYQFFTVTKIIANDIAYQNSLVRSSMTNFGDFKCWEFPPGAGSIVPPALFEIRDQFNPVNPILNDFWEQAAYCAAASKSTQFGNFDSPFAPTGFNQHYQAWFYPPGIPNAGTGTDVILEVPQFDHTFTTTLLDLDSIMVPASKQLQTGQIVDSADTFQHWNCYNIIENPINEPLLLTTQHGDQNGAVLDPFLLCAPMEKLDPFTQNAFGDPTLDEHMVCYDLSATPVNPALLPVLLEDQLTTTPLPFIPGFEETICATAIKSFPVTVGGSDVAINTSALLLAGATSNSMWMIPVIVAGIGIGIFVIKRRN